MHGQGGAWSSVCELWAPGDPQFQRSLPVACGALSWATVEFPSCSWEQNMKSESKPNVEERLENHEVCRGSKVVETNLEIDDAELCDTYGYELAMSSAKTDMPDDEDPSRFSDDSRELDEFDLLEPFLLDSGNSSKRKRRPSEIHPSWFSDDSCESQTSAVQMFTEEFDQLETSLFTLEHSSKSLACLYDNDNQSLCEERQNLNTAKNSLVVDHNCSHGQDGNIYRNLDPTPDQRDLTVNALENGYSTRTETMCSVSDPSQAAQQKASQKSIAETTLLVQALVRGMTLGQKMKFYAWFNSGLSIEESAVKSRIPDLIPPPVRHPNCELSKKRLKRLSKILPNVYLQRHFVYETYFAGLNPKEIMKCLLTNLGLEELVSTFEHQLTLEELATQEKLLRRNRLDETAADAPAIVEQPSNQTSESFDGSVQRHFDTRLEEQTSRINLRNANGFILEGVELKRYYFWRKQGLSIKEAISKANMPGQDHEIVPHPNCEHSWEKLQQLAQALPNKVLREMFLMKVYFGGKDPGEVLKIILSSRNENRPSESNQVAQDVSDTDENVLLENVVDIGVDETPLDAQVSREKPFTQSEDVTSIANFETLVDANVSIEKPSCESENYQLQTTKNKPRSSTPDSNYPYYDIKDEPEKVLSDKHTSNETDFVTGTRPGVGPDTASNCEESEIPRMSLNQLKKYYKWRNLGFNYSEALAKAKIPGLLPEAHLPHPSCKYSWEEVRNMSDAIPLKHKRLQFQIEVLYGGKKPADVMKCILASTDVRGSSPKSNLTSTESVSGENCDRSHVQSVAREAQGNLSNEENTELSKISLNQLKKYYKWRNQGLSISEALEKAKVPGLIPEAGGPHPGCKSSWDEIKEFSSRLPTRSAQYRFQIETFYGGKEPHELLKHMSAGISKPPVALSPNVENNNSVMDPVDNCNNLTIPSFLKNGLGIESTVSGDVDIVTSNTVPTFLGNEISGDESTYSGGMGIVPSNAIPSFIENEIGVEDTDPQKLDDVTNAQGNPALALSNRPLKKYYSWLNKGFSHDEAFSKATTKMSLTGTELENFYSAHPQCKYSCITLKKMSKVLPGKFQRDRFLIHTFLGGMDPDCAINLVKSCTPQDVLVTEDKLTQGEKKVRRKVRINYLVGKGLTREEALSKMRHPSKELLKELEEVIQVSFGEKRVAQSNQHGLPVDQNSSMYENRPESNTIPLSSPYHPSKLLSEVQLKNYYLWISNGYSREGAFSKVLAQEPITRGMYNVHYEKSKFDLQEMKRMSKTLPNELAETFVIETFYGGSDPEETMKYLLSLENSTYVSSGLGSTPRQGFSHEITTNPWFPSNKDHDVVSSPIHPAEVPLTIAPVPVAHCFNYLDPALQLQYQTNLGQIYPYDPVVVADPPSRYPQPAGKCAPMGQQHFQPISNSIEPSITSQNNVASNSVVGSPNAMNHASGDNELQCFIVLANYPNECLTEPQMDAIEESILEAILEMDDDDAKPSFKNSFRSNGRYGLACNDEFSIDWLYKYLAVYEPWEGASLRLMINKSTKVTANAILPLCEGDDDKKIMKFIEKQNSGLKVGKWTVVQRWDSSDGNTLLDLIIDEESADILQKCSTINFKFGVADIITAKNDNSSSTFCNNRSSEYLADSPREQSAPPLPSSPPPSSKPPPTPPPPPPSPPPPPKKPCIIDTSLGSLLKISAAKSGDRELSRKIRDKSPQSSRKRFRSPHATTSSPDRIHRKRWSRKGRSYSREQNRSRSSSLDSICRSRPERTRKRRRSKKDRKRSASRSSSRDKTHKNKRTKICKKKQKQPASRSPLLERYGAEDWDGTDDSWLDWFYPMNKRRSPNRISRNPKRAPPRSTSACSFVSSEENFSPLTDESRRSCSPRRSRHIRVGSVENTEYEHYLKNSCSPKPPAKDVIDLTN